MCIYDFWKIAFIKFLSILLVVITPQVQIVTACKCCCCLCDDGDATAATPCNRAAMHYCTKWNLVARQTVSPLCHGIYLPATRWIVFLKSFTYVPTVVTNLAFIHCTPATVAVSPVAFLADCLASATPTTCPLHCKISEWVEPVSQSNFHSLCNICTL